VKDRAFFKNVCVFFIKLIFQKVMKEIVKIAFSAKNVARGRVIDRKMLRALKVNTAYVL